VDPSTGPVRGAAALARNLTERTTDVRALDPVGFRGWLHALLTRWQTDPVFTQRTVIRDLRRTHPDLLRLESDYRRAVAADEAGEVATRIRELDRELTGIGKAVTGLTAALAAARDTGLVATKLADFRSKQSVLLAERTDLVRGSPARQALLAAGAELASVREATGLARAEAELARRLTRRGRAAGHAGESFEQVVASSAVGLLARDFSAAGPIRVLRRVRLGAARAEFDLLVVRAPGHATEAVEVLAAVEAKRNINDLAHGFRRRQEDLAWVTNDPKGYDPDLTRTRHFPTGRFDRPAEHREDGETHLFAPGSFHRFRRDPAAGLFLDGLYLVSRSGPIRGLSSAALARIADRVATDPGWAPDDWAYLNRLFAWVRDQAGPVETPDVLRTYCSREPWARQVVLLPAAPG